METHTSLRSGSKKGFERSLACVNSGLTSWGSAPLSLAPASRLTLDPNSLPSPRGSQQHALPKWGHLGFPEVARDVRQLLRPGQRVATAPPVAWTPERHPLHPWWRLGNVQSPGPWWPIPKFCPEHAPRPQPGQRGRPLWFYLLLSQQPLRVPHPET